MLISLTGRTADSVVEPDIPVVAQLSNSASIDVAPSEQSVRTQILSVVCTLSGQEPHFPSALKELHEALCGVSPLAELVVILNGPAPSAVTTLRRLADDCEHLQIYVTRRRVDYSTALMAGIEHAIGDWVATIDIEADNPSLIRWLFEAALREQAEVALSLPGLSKRPLIDTIASGVFHRVFRALHGFDLTSGTPSARLLSRAVVNSLLSDDSPLIAFETLPAGAAYRKCIVPCVRRPAFQLRRGEAAQIRWRTLIGIDAAPLRLANLFSGISAAGGLLYSFYVVVIYVVKRDVVPGWTTLSLMQSAMFMMLALVLWLLSEYMLMLLDPGSKRPRYEIADEFKGRTHPGDNALNVEAEV